jgi:hypothetical protein
VSPCVGLGGESVRTAEPVLLLWVECGRLARHDGSKGARKKWVS